MDKFISRTQMQTILDARPKGVSMDEVINGYRSNGYKVEGIDQPEQTLGQQAKDIAIGAGKGLARTVVDTAKGLQTIGQGAMMAVGVPNETVAQTGFKSLDPSQPEGQALQQKLEPTNDMQKYGGYAETGAEALLGGGASLVKDTAVGGSKLLAKGVKPVTQAVVKGVGNTIAKVTPSVEQAVANTEKGIMDIVENKKSLLNNFSKSEGTGKNPVKIISENPDYAIRVNPETRSLDTTDAVTNMKRDISSFSQVRDNLLKVADETLPPIKTNDVINKALTTFSNKNYSTYLDEGEKAVAGIVKKLKTLQKYNPDTVTRENLNSIRKGLDDTINSFTDTKLQDKVRLDLRKVFQTTLEDSIPESGLLKNLNAQIGDIIDASKFTEKSLHGTKVKGGGLTDLAMKTAGASTGAVLGGSVVGGVPGAIGGYLLTNFLSKNLIKNAINNPFDRKILETLRQSTPDIVRQAEEFIANSKNLPVVK